MHLLNYVLVRSKNVVQVLGETEDAAKVNRNVVTDPRSSKICANLIIECHKANIPD